MPLENPIRAQEEVDLQFDCENHYWDVEHYIDYFLKQSARVRQQYKCIEDISVGAREQEQIDVFPSKTANSPIVIFVHGGWWRSGTRKVFSFCAEGLVERGYTVITSDYSLCPTVTMDQITAATRLAVRWAYDNAATINGDPERIYVIGHSAGGHQAAMMAITDWPTSSGLPADVIKGAVPLSGLFDLRPFKWSWLQPMLQLTDEMIDLESPLFHIPDVAPPMLVVLGGEESTEFHLQSIAFVDAWRERGHRADYLDLEGEDHVTSIMRLSDPQSELCEKIADFFEGRS